MACHPLPLPRLLPLLQVSNSSSSGSGGDSSGSNK